MHAAMQKCDETDQDHELSLSPFKRTWDAIRVGQHLPITKYADIEMESTEPGWQNLLVRQE